MTSPRAPSRRPASPILAALTSLLLAGCAVGPDYKAPGLAVPSHWGSAPAKTAPRPPKLAQWWKQLHDPLLDQIVDEAVAGNLDVATAKAKIREARASYRQAVGTLLPNVTGSASATRADNGSNVSSGGDVTVQGPYSQYQAGLDASWELDLFGANRRAVEAARYGLDAAQEDLRATLVTLIGDVTSYYAEARAYQARAELARRTAASQRETAALTRKRFEAGQASAMDVANAAGQAASTQADVPVLETGYTEAVHQLSVLTGRPPSALSMRLAGARPIPAPKLPIATGIPADMLLTRPDLRVAEREYAQSTAAIGEAEAALYPSVSLTGSIASNGTRLGDLARGSSISWSFGPTLTVPIFNGGQLRAAVEVTQAQRDQSFLSYQAAVLTALEEVENAIVALGQERIRRDTLATSAGHYREAARLARALYQSGSSSFLDVLDAERSLYSAEDSLIQSRAAITTDYIALNKALGGGWSGTLDASKPVIVDSDTGPHVASPPVPALPSAQPGRLAAQPPSPVQ